MKSVFGKYLHLILQILVCTVEMSLVEPLKCSAVLGTRGESSSEEQVCCHCSSAVAVLRLETEPSG